MNDQRDCQAVFLGPAFEGARGVDDRSVRAGTRVPKKIAGGQP